MNAMNLSEEKLQLTPFLSSNVPNLASPTKPRGVALQALNNVKRRKVVLQYVSLGHIPQIWSKDPSVPPYWF